MGSARHLRRAELASGESRSRRGERALWLLRPADSREARSLPRGPRQRVSKSERKSMNRREIMQLAGGVSAAAAVGAQSASAQTSKQTFRARSRRLARRLVLAQSGGSAARRRPHGFRADMYRTWRQGAPSVERHYARYVH